MNFLHYFAKARACEEENQEFYYYKAKIDEIKEEIGEKKALKWSKKADEAIRKGYT
jgi:hypothetical protein